MFMIARLVIFIKRLARCSQNREPCGTIPGPEDLGLAGAGAQHQPEDVLFDRLANLYRGEGALERIEQARQVTIRVGPCQAHRHGFTSAGLSHRQQRLEFGITQEGAAIALPMR
jgi:hypothetical protein